MQSALVSASGWFDIALALFHVAFWRLFKWPASLSGMGQVNRGILYLLNGAIIYLFLLMGVVLLCCGADPGGEDIIRALLGSMGLFWLLRAAAQAPFFGLRHPASLVLFSVFLAGAAVHAAAAWVRGGV